MHVCLFAGRTASRVIPRVLFSRSVSSSFCERLKNIRQRTTGDDTQYSSDLHTCTHECIQTHVHTCAYTLVHTHAYIHVYTQAHTHALTHAYAHTCIHIQRAALQEHYITSSKRHTDELKKSLAHQLHFPKGQTLLSPDFALGGEGQRSVLGTATAAGR